jgi:hypothetical protein
MCNAKSLPFINKYVEGFIMPVMQLISIQVYNISYKLYFNLKIGNPCTFTKLNLWIFLNVVRL